MSNQSIKKETLNVSVIIPFKNKAKMTLDCVTSLFKFGPDVKEVLLISNNSSQSELDTINKYAQEHAYPLRVLEYNHPFNYQKMNNWAVKQSSGEFILFLNNDTELKEESVGLLEAMVKKASQKDVGITGCLLLYGDEKVIQHAGVFLLPRGMADHLYVGKKLSKVLENGGKTPDMPYSVTEDRPLTSVTGAVNILERKKFDEVGGFDERFIIGGGDVDLCIRLNKKGYQTWYVTNGKSYIVHKESQSRSHKAIPYSDFYHSYLSYLEGYDTKVGDPFLPKITRGL